MFYGYSIESIQSFFDRYAHISGLTKLEVVPDSDGTVFSSLGYIPSAEERKRDPVEVVVEINARRIASWPFSLNAEDKRKDDTEVDRFFESERFQQMMNESIPNLGFYG